jgi:hypothetical protein
VRGAGFSLRITVPAQSKLRKDPSNLPSANFLIVGNDGRLLGFVAAAVNLAVMDTAERASLTQHFFRETTRAITLQHRRGTNIRLRMIRSPSLDLRK